MKVLKSAERFGKNILIRLVKIFIKQESFNLSDLDISKVDRIIIVHLDRKVGNLILTTPLLEATKKVFQNATVDILISSPVKVLIESNPFLTHVFEFNHSRFIRNPFRLFSLITSIRKNNYLVAIESSNPSGTSFLNGCITNLTKAKYRIGFSGGSGSLFTNIHITPNKADHYLLSKQKLVQVFTNQIFSLKPKIFVDKRDVENVKQNLVSRFNIEKSKKIIGIWIGARDNKKWDIENFYSIYQQIIKETSYFSILMFGIEEIKQFDKIDKTKFNALSFTDLNVLKNFISSCNIFISCDTGPLHYAYALDVNTIGIFLQDNFKTYGYNAEGKNYIIKPDETTKMIEEVLRVIKLIEEKPI